MVAKRAEAVGIEALGDGTFHSCEAENKQGIELVDLAEIWKRSDAVTLHVPLTEQTKNMAAAPQLAQMKPGALLVNCARGGLIDEKALADALEAGKLGGAAPGGFEEEAPPADHP